MIFTLATLAALAAPTDQMTPTQVVETVPQGQTTENYEPGEDQTDIAHERAMERAEDKFNASMKDFVEGKTKDWKTPLKEGLAAGLDEGVLKQRVKEARQKVAKNKKLKTVKAPDIR